MGKLEENYAQIDPVWDRVRHEALEAVRSEPAVGGFIHTNILQHLSFENALAHRIASKLASSEISEQTVRDICFRAVSKAPQIANSARADVMAVVDRDPA
ncbi:MAG: serine O-acetyltransferase, partial [Paracoccaceae bacterium]